jgi:hypothetical protein
MNASTVTTMTVVVERDFGPNVTTVMVLLLKEAMNLLYDALWKQCTETRACSLSYGLLCTCISIQRSKICLRVNGWQLSQLSKDK